LGFIPSITAQSIVDSNEKIGYTHYKTPVNGFLMHYVIGGKGDPIDYCTDGLKLGMSGDT
jgi:hypothetical protein